MDFYGEYKEKCFRKYNCINRLLSQKMALLHFGFEYIQKEREL